MAQAVAPHSVRKKEKGRKIVLIRGAFDVLHFGHVRAFYRAKKFGEVLVVALDSNKLVALRKPGRPIFTQKIRKEMLLHLKPVDYVFVTSVDGAFDIIHSLRPDILVVKASSDTPHGSSGSRSKVKKFCRERDIKIITDTSPPDYSSTNILAHFDV